MKFRSKIISLCSAAAALVIVAAMAAFAAGGLELGTPKPDHVSLGQPEVPAPTDSMPASAVYYTEKGVYFHTIPDCSGMMGASAHDLGDAFATGKGACPVCVDLEKILPCTTPTVTAMPTPKPMLSAETTVFCTENGTYYHAHANCSGMMNARSTLPEQAEADGKVPCPVCLTSDANAWFSTSATLEPVEVRYGLDAKNTPTPMPAAIDIGFSTGENALDFDIFRELFGREFPEAFPDYSLEAEESWLFDSGYVHWSVSNGKSTISIDETPIDGDRDGVLQLSMDDSAAAFRLMKNAPEPLHTIYMELAPEMIANVLAAAGKNTAQTHRLGDIILMYSHDFHVTTAELTYYMNDGSNVHLAWKNCETTPELYFMQWVA